MGVMAELDISIPRSREAGQFARNAIAPIADWLPADKAHDLNLVVSELVNNAVEHGAGQIAVVIHALPHSIAGSVWDGGVGFTAPAIATHDNDRSDGWGLTLVDQLTRRWGVEREPTRVWFELVIP